MKDDDALIEAMARAMLKSGYSSFWSADDLKGMAHHALAVARPIIEAPLLERLDAFEMDGASCADEVKRLRAENEKLRAATGSLVRSLSGCWYAFEPSLRREMGNTNYHCVKEKMDEVEALLDFRAAAAALKETGDE